MKASDIRRGTVLIYQGNPYRVMDFQHRTPGNLRAFVQVRMRNLNTGTTLDTRFASTELVEDARLDTRLDQHDLGALAETVDERDGLRLGDREARRAHVAGFHRRGGVQHDDHLPCAFSHDGHGRAGEGDG